MKKSVKLLIAAAVVVFAAVNILKCFNPKIKTEMVLHGEMEKSYSFDAMIIRDESVVKADSNGVLESMVSENEMVKKGKHVASIYENAVDENIKKKLIHVNERIAEIKNAGSSATDSFGDNYRAESNIDAKISEMIDASQERDVSKLVSIKNELGLLNDKKNALSGDSSQTREILNSLQKEKAGYEKNLSDSHQDLFSPTSGIYSTKIDGYEELVTPASAMEMTPSDFESVKDTKISKETIAESGIVCKIIDSYEWSVAVIVTDEELSSLKTGDTVYIRNHSSADDAKAVIKYISSPENGKYVLTAASDVACSWAMDKRFVKIDLIKKKYSGLKVPASALRVKDDVAGVYTASDGIVQFKPVNILYKNGTYAIVEENNTLGRGLLLYDEVIVSSGRNIKSGMRINK